MLTVEFRQSVVVRYGASKVTLIKNDQCAIHWTLRHKLKYNMVDSNVRVKVFVSEGSNNYTFTRWLISCTYQVVEWFKDTALWYSWKYWDQFRGFLLKFLEKVFFVQMGSWYQIKWVRNRFSQEIAHLCGETIVCINQIFMEIFVRVLISIKVDTKRKTNKTDCFLEGKQTFLAFKYCG